MSFPETPINWTLSLDSLTQAQAVSSIEPTAPKKLGVNSSEMKPRP